MTRIDPATARDIIARCGAEGDFHALSSEVVERLLDFAGQYGYRKPKNANGSRGRCWHAHLQRVARRKGA